MIVRNRFLSRSIFISLESLTDFLSFKFLKIPEQLEIFCDLICFQHFNEMADLKTCRLCGSVKEACDITSSIDSIDLDGTTLRNHIAFFCHTKLEVTLTFCKILILMIYFILLGKSRLAPIRLPNLSIDY